MSRLNYGTSRRLGLEPLEGRQLMAAVTAIVNTSGDLVVTGDDNENTLQIVQAMQNGAPITGKFFITPQNGTTLNGQSSGQYFEHVNRNMSIDLGGANDRLTLGSGGLDGNFVVPADLNITMGEGADVVRVNHLAVRDDATIDTGNGNDSVIFKGTVGQVSGFDNGANDLTIKTGARCDNVLLQQVLVRRNININTGTDDFTDFVTLDTVINGNAGTTTLNTGAGSDVVDIEDSSFNKDLALGTGGGADSVTIRNSSADQVFVFLGIGQDSLTFDHAHGRNAMLDGGTDTDSDTLNIIARDFTGVFSQQHFDRVFNS
jgi:hypothetical protein